MKENMPRRVHILFFLLFGSALLPFAAINLLFAADATAGSGREVITGSLFVGDKRTYPDGLTVGGALTVTGALSVTHGLTVGKGVSVTGSLVVADGMAVGVMGESALATGRLITGGLVVTGAQALRSGVVVSGSLVVTGEGALAIEGALRVTGDVTVTGKLTVRPFRFFLPFVAQTVIHEAENGGFENGTTLWHQYSSDGRQLIVPAPDGGVPAHSGSWMARLGGEDNEVSMISQGVSIARDTSCLVFWQWTVSDDLCNADYGGVGVNGRWVNVSTLCAGTSTARWVRRQVSMTVYSAEMTTTATVLNFAVTNDYSVASTMYIDDIAFYPTTLCAETSRSTLEERNSEDGGAQRLIGKPIDLAREDDF